ncbi:MAG: hypothetical protein QF632_01915 [Candidatus Woesearchaeota archaeon]|nr:hypothetical protein [Candidatus Woesearchaeota archaeon]MDP7458189.1 hypothetical protein [Candidatus Woesearchaeota archaeon]
MNEIKQYCKEKARKVAIVGALYITLVNPGIGYFISNSPKKWVQDAYHLVHTKRDNISDFLYEGLK